MTESDLEKWAAKYARGKGVLAYKFRSPNRRGVPDQMFLFNGQTLFVEFKSPSGLGKLSPLQVKEIATLNAAGFFVEVIKDKDTFKAVLSGFIERATR